MSEIQVLAISGRYFQEIFIFQKSSALVRSALFPLCLQNGRPKAGFILFLDFSHHQSKEALSDRYFFLRLYIAKVSGAFFSLALIIVQPTYIGYQE